MDLAPDLDDFLKDVLSDGNQEISLPSLADAVQLDTAINSWFSTSNTAQLCSASRSGQSGSAPLDVLADHLPASSQDIRLAKKRLNQRNYRAREKQQRQEANSRLAELHQMLAKLSVENARLKLKAGALATMVAYLDQLVNELVTDAPQPGVPYSHEWLVCAKTAQSVTVEQFQDIWKRFIGQGADLLMQCDAGNAEAEQLLEAGVEVAERFMMNIEIIRPALADKLTTINLETGETFDPGEEFWKQMVLGLGLSQQQLNQISESVAGEIPQQLEDARNRLLRELRELAEQDTRSLDVLNDALTKGDRTTAINATGHLFNSHTTRSHLTIVPALEKMLQREGLVGALLSMHVCGMVLTPKQKVQMVVSTYPYLIHTRQVMKSIKQLKDERAALRSRKSREEK